MVVPLARSNAGLPSVNASPSINEHAWIQAHASINCEIDSRKRVATKSWYVILENLAEPHSVGARHERLIMNRTLTLDWKHLDDDSLMGAGKASFVIPVQRELSGRPWVVALMEREGGTDHSRMLARRMIRMEGTKSQRNPLLRIELQGQTLCGLRRLHPTSAPNSWSLCNATLWCFTLVLLTTVFKRLFSFHNISTARSLPSTERTRRESQIEPRTSLVLPSGLKSVDGDDNDASTASNATDSRNQYTEGQRSTSGQASPLFAPNSSSEEETIEVVTLHDADETWSSDWTGQKTPLASKRASLGSPSPFADEDKEKIKRPPTIRRYGVDPLHYDILFPPRLSETNQTGISRRLFAQLKGTSRPRSQQRLFFQSPLRPVQRQRPSGDEANVPSRHPVTVHPNQKSFSSETRVDVPTKTQPRFPQSTVSYNCDEYKRIIDVFAEFADRPHSDFGITQQCHKTLPAPTTAAQSTTCAQNCQERQQSEPHAEGAYSQSDNRYSDCSAGAPHKFDVVGVEQSETAKGRESAPSSNVAYESLTAAPFPPEKRSIVRGALTPVDPKVVERTEGNGGMEMKELSEPTCLKISPTCLSRIGRSTRKTDNASDKEKLAKETPSDETGTSQPTFVTPEPGETRVQEKQAEWRDPMKDPPSIVPQPLPQPATFTVRNEPKNNSSTFLDGNLPCAAPDSEPERPPLDRVRHAGSETPSIGCVDGVASRSGDHCERSDESYVSTLSPDSDDTSRAITHKDEFEFESDTHPQVATEASPTRRVIPSVAHGNRKPTERKGRRKTAMNLRLGAAANHKHTRRSTRTTGWGANITELPSGTNVDPVEVDLDKSDDKSVSDNFLTHVMVAPHTEHVIPDVAVSSSLVSTAIRIEAPVWEYEASKDSGLAPVPKAITTGSRDRNRRDNGLRPRKRPISNMLKKLRPRKRRRDD